MSTGMVTMQVPAPLYADLESLAAEEQVEPVKMFARLVETARQRRAWLRDLDALREQIRQDGGLSVGTSKEQVVEQMRRTRYEIFEAEYAHLYR